MFKVLIVEDDRDLRQLFSRVLTKNGYAVVGASNGAEALDEMKNSFFDIIISDVMMPEMDGYEFVRTLREAGDYTPVLMISAKDAFDDMQTGFSSGSDDYHNFFLAFLLCIRCTDRVVVKSFCNTCRKCNKSGKKHQCTDYKDKIYYCIVTDILSG